MRWAIAVAVLAVAASPLRAQVHGTPPSVTSIGPGGISSAPAPSVTSMGPFGWQVPHGKFFPNGPQFFPRQPGFNQRTHSGRGHHGTGAYVVPWYAPYPVYVYPDQAYTDATEPAPADEAAAPVPGVPAAAVPYQPPVPPAPPAPSAPPAAPMAELPVQETTILVFRDGHRMEITDYAIVGQELLNLSGKGPRRIPLVDLDLPATTRVNDDRGVGFRLPNS